jgi:O-antigen ligase
MSSERVAEQQGFAPILFGVLGASFHVLGTPSILGVPVRVSLADFMLGLVVVLCVLRVAMRKAPVPRVAFGAWHFFWLAAMLAVLCVSYARVGIAGDAAAAWALLKVVGLGVLIAYFVIAGWIGAADGGNTARWAMKGFIVAAWLHAAYGLGQYAMYFYLDYKIPWYPRIAGLAENPNSYGIMLAAALAMYWGSSAWSPLFNRHRLEFWGTTVTILALYLSASRSAYLGTFVALMGLIISTNFEDRKIFRPAIMAIAVFVSLFIIVPAAPDIYYKVSQALTETTEGTADQEQARSSFDFMKKNYAISRGYVDQGVTSRMKLYTQAVEMWMEQPWLGAGLGAFWRLQQQLADKAAYLNHNTVLWLASEMGVVGLMVFGGAVVLACMILARNARRIGLAGGAFGVLLVLIGASAGTEVMYQRYAWFFCGLALALARYGRRDAEALAKTPGTAR